MATKRNVDKDPSHTDSSSKKPRLRVGHWSMGLVASMENPDLVVESDELCVVIKDAYPKAKHHFLILPKEAVPNLKSLNSSHVHLLKHMYELGQARAAKISKTEPNLEFRHGYHAAPSMSRLHMHVISQDFDSPCLKHKKHWNSFTTEFFIDASSVIKMLEEKGKVEIDIGHYSEMLKRNLHCHQCRKPLSNMPKLKEHIRHCVKC